MNKKIILTIFIILVLSIGGVYLIKNKKYDLPKNSYQTSQSNIENQNTLNDIKTENESAENQVSNSGDVLVEENISENKPNEVKEIGSYEEYGAEKIARAESGVVVLFFHASWCPSCRGLNSDIEKNLENIPFGVSILKTDYDKETELKKKYGVNYQHTLVQVDKDGNMIKKWSGGGSLEKLLAQIQ